ncbi:hypothetical protein [Ideonella sp.]|uniref:hypothetical protein n=1 Tax=Ideonella sp. TaxID=1929293 RepID=UPI0035B4F217
MNEKIHTGAFAVLSALLALSSSGAQAVTFSCKPLMDGSASAGDSQMHAGAINNRQQVVGFAFAPYEGEYGFGAATWGKDRQAVRLNDEAGGFTVHSDANDINDAGQVVGDIYERGGRERAVTWVDGQMSFLPNLAGDQGGGAALAINKKGQIVGRSHALLAGQLVWRATRWFNGAPVDLGALKKNGESIAFGINDAGVVIGASDVAGQVGAVPVRWVGHKISALPLPAGAAGTASGINAAGTIVGSVIAQGDTHRTAYAWQGDQGVAMSKRSADTDTYAEAVNAQGVVIGSELAPGASYGVPLYWAAVDAQPVDLNELVGPAGCVDAFGQARQLIGARDINDNGVIIATAVNPSDYRSYSFRLTPR